MKKLLYSAPVLFLASTGALLAQEGDAGDTPSYTPIVSTSTVQSTIIDAVGPWLVIGVGIAISVTVVYLGWKWIRRFIGK